MQTSEQVTELITALAAAQGEFPAIQKKKTAAIQGTSKKTGQAYSVKYNYADISDVLAAVTPILSKHKIVLTQPTILEGENMIIRTYLWHASGQWMYADYSVCQIVGDHQAMGGALTYARRYAACTLLGIAAEEDVDGRGAEDPVPRKAPAPPKQEVPVNLSDEDFARFRTKIDDRLKDVTDATTLSQISDWAFEQLRKDHATGEQFVAMEGIFAHKTAEVGTVPKTEKRKAPPPPRSDKPYVETTVNYETLRKQFIDQVDGLSDYDEVAASWETIISPHLNALFPPDASEAQALLRSYEKKLAP